jgi:hypothetical protein
LTYDGDDNASAQAKVVADLTSNGGQGGSGSTGGGAGAGGDATAATSLRGVASGDATLNAVAGAGGENLGASGAKGGDADGDGTVKAMGAASVTVAAYGGVGGAGGDRYSAPGTGGAGGDAAASATARDHGASAVAIATAFAGGGGAASGAGQTGGVGAAATVSANAVETGAGYAEAQATAVAGGGGYGYLGADGGDGAAISLDDVVGGSSRGTYLSLIQTAEAGSGGSAFNGPGHGGDGGAATSMLDFDQAFQGAHTPRLNIQTEADGGGGGLSSQAVRQGDGGDAHAEVNVTSAGDLTATAIARGGLSSSYMATRHMTGSGGEATADTTATGADVDAYASAFGGSGAKDGGAASTVTATGGSGEAAAFAENIAANGAMVYQVSATAQGEVDGTSLTQARSDIGGNADKLHLGPEAEAYVTGAPSSASVAQFEAANATVASALGHGAVGLGEGSMEVAFSGGTGHSQTSSATLDVRVDLTQLDPDADIVLGLGGVKAQGHGFHDLTFEVFAHGAEVVDETFANKADALAYFHDHPLDLGEIGAQGYTFVDFQIVLTATESTSGSAFGTQILLGATEPSSADVHGLVV